MNFLLTWQEFIKESTHNTILNFLSFEKYPFAKEDLRRAHSKYPSLSKESRELISKMPINSSGVHRINLNEGRIKLTLIYGDLKDNLLNLNENTNYDAWYLDGFSPSKNPEMWSREMAMKIGEVSNSSTTIATYSVAGVVKENLSEAGFLVKKINGFGTKRQMLSGSSLAKKVRLKSSKKKICIVGAGIAGCSLSKILSDRNHEVTIFDKEESAASLATGNPVLVIYPRLSAYDTPHARFSIESFLYSSKFYDHLDSQYWNKSGVLMMNFDENSNKRENSLLNTREDQDLFIKLDSIQASFRSGIEVQNGGLFFQNAGYIEPKYLCDEMLSHGNIVTNFLEEVISVKKINESNKVITTKGEYEFDEVCFCNSYSLNKIFNFEGLSKKRGQVSIVSTNNILNKLKFPICAGGYLSPNIEGNHTAGSSYSNVTSSEILEKEHHETLKKINKIYEGNLEIIDGKVGFRAVTRDRVPLAGKFKDFYVNIGHGSRGATSAPICSEYIADLIENKPLPIGSEIEKILNPERFIPKNLQ